MNLFEKISAYNKMHNVLRWKQHKANLRYNLMEHTLRVVLFINEIFDRYNKQYGVENECEYMYDKFTIANLRLRCIDYALYHDLGESLSPLGDVDHAWKKRYPHLKQVADEIEDEETTKVVGLLEHDELVKSIVKFADILDYTIESLWNINVEDIELEYHKAIARGLKDMQIRIDSCFKEIALEMRQELISVAGYVQPKDLDFSY